MAKGESASDESALTGEAIPVAKGSGDQVYSGTVNLWGAVDFDVSRLPSESTLERIIRLIRTAQKMRAPSERFTDRFGTGYTYMVIGGRLRDVPPLVARPRASAVRKRRGRQSAFYRAMTLMVVASPCALVLSIPSAILASIAWGARHGILFRGGAAVERLAEVDVVALDKTGTLTTGELAVVELIESFPVGPRAGGARDWRAPSRPSPQHPIARAILRRAREGGIRDAEVEDFRSITGQGLKGSIGGSTLLLGRRELLEDGPLAEWARSLPPAAAELSEVWIVERELIGRLLLKDRSGPSRPGSCASSSGWASGRSCSPATAGTPRKRSPGDLGLDEVRAGLSPEEKVGPSGRSRRRATRSRWSGTASTTRRAWRPPTSESPWGPGVATPPSSRPRSS